MSTYRILLGDCRETLRTLPDASVQCCVTSPPYWGLRDYGHDGQLGLEQTPDEYVAHMVEVFREVRRLLRPDGTLWLNLGDSYAAQRGGTHQPAETLAGAKGGRTEDGQRVNRGRHDGYNPTRNAHAIGLKHKDLIGIPWRVAFALQADGWYLRSDIIWAKPNPMPESVTDRPTKAHEYVFLFAKGQWSTRVIQFADLPSERFHLLDNLRSNTTNVGSGQIAVRLAASILDCAQREHEFRLSAFNSEIWQEGANGRDGDGIGGLPVVHRAAVLAARLLYANATTKEFFCELNRLGVALTNGDKLLVGGGAAEFPLPPGVFGDGKATITVHHAGQISKIDFSHGTYTTLRPSGCSYYYDADAIAEPAVSEHASGNGFARPQQTSQRPQRVRAEQLFRERGLTEAHREAIRAVGMADAGKALRTMSGAGRNAEETQRLADEAKAALGGYFREFVGGDTRNARSVWTIATQPFSGAHFAVFPPELAERCIKAGSKPGDVVLDPFGGSGTTGMVATGHGRRAILCELNPAYADLIRERCGPMLEAA